MTADNGWRETIASICEAPVITHPVGGHDVKFWPISVAMLVKMRSIGRPLAQALGALMGNNQSDVRREMTQSDDTAIETVDGDDGQQKKVLVGVTGTNTSHDAISVELARFRADQKEMAIDRIVDAFTKTENQLVIAALVFDSCREIFPRRPENDDLAEFISEQANLVVMSQFLSGIMKANAQALGKLGEQLTESVTKIVRKRISEVDADVGTEDPILTKSPTESESPSLTVLPPAPPPAPSPST